MEVDGDPPRIITGKRIPFQAKSSTIAHVDVNCFRHTDNKSAASTTFFTKSPLVQICPPRHSVENFLATAPSMTSERPSLTTLYSPMRNLQITQSIPVSIAGTSSWPSFHSTSNPQSEPFNPSPSSDSFEHSHSLDRFAYPDHPTPSNCNTPRSMERHISVVSSTASVYSQPPAEVLHCDESGCGVPFSGIYRAGNLARHKRAFHRGPKVYFCEGENCDKIFKRPDARLKHYRRHHAHLVKDRPFMARDRQTRRPVEDLHVELSNMSGWVE